MIGQETSRCDSKNNLEIWNIADYVCTKQCYLFSLYFGNHAQLGHWRIHCLAGGFNHHRKLGLFGLLFKPWRIVPNCLQALVYSFFGFVLPRMGKVVVGV